MNDLHEHIVGKRGLTMLMWADRLIDGKQLKMGEWEASEVGTAAAIDKIPKDIILCPWHYELRKQYESLPMMMDKGFRILPASWKNIRRHAGPHSRRPSSPKRRFARRSYLYHMVAESRRLGRVRTPHERLRTAAEKGSIAASVYSGVLIPSNPSATNYGR